LTYFFEWCRLLGEFLLPESNILPHTYREIFVIMKEIEMEYQAILDACSNDHTIYYRQYASENEFPQCQISIYRTDKVTKKVPRKVLHYICIIPCFQQLFRCQSIMQFIDFHEKNKSEDDVLQIPTNGSTLKYIEEK